MNKLSIVLAALLMASGAQAQETTFKFGGSTELGYENTDNYDFTDNTEDRRDEFVQTTKLHVDAVKGDNLSARISLRNLSLWGDTNAYNSSETAEKGEVAKSNLFLVEEAYGVWKINDASVLQFGRGAFELAKGELIAKRESEHIPVTFDGAMLMNDFESFRFALFGVQAVDNGFNLSEGSAAAVTNDRNGYFIGGTFTFKNLPEFLNNVTLHYVDAKSDAFTTPAISKNTRNWIGVSATGETGAIDYHVAYDQFSGEIVASNLDRDGTMMHLEAGFNMPEMMGFRGALAYHVDSGDEDGNAATDSDAYDPLYYDYDNYSGRMEIVKWGCGYEAGCANAVIGTGVTSIALKLKMEPSEDLKVNVDYYMFTATEKGSGTEDEIGNELDITVKKTYANGFHTTLEYDMFQGGDRISTTADDATRVFLAAGFDF